MKKNNLIAKVEIIKFGDSPTNEENEIQAVIKIAVFEVAVANLLNVLQKVNPPVILSGRYIIFPGQNNRKHILFSSHPWTISLLWTRLDDTAVSRYVVFRKKTQLCSSTKLDCRASWYWKSSRSQIQDLWPRGSRTICRQFGRIERGSIFDRRERFYDNDLDWRWPRNYRF